MNEFDFGFRVRSRRRLLGITQDDLGKAVGISQVSIRKIEAGGQTRHGRKIAETLKTTLQWLETGKDPVTDDDGSVGGEAASGLHRECAEPDLWPLKKSTPNRIRTLSPAQQRRADDALDAILKGLEAEGK